MPRKIILRRELQPTYNRLKRKCDEMIREVTRLLNSKSFVHDKYKAVDEAESVAECSQKEAPALNKMKLDGSMAQTSHVALQNQEVKDLAAILNQYVRSLHKDILSVKLWAFMFITDMNLQKAAMTSLYNIEKSVVLNMFRIKLLFSADLENKNPSSDNHEQVVEEGIHHQFHSGRIFLCEMRSSYSALRDIVDILTQ